MVPKQTNIVPKQIKFVRKNYIVKLEKPTSKIYFQTLHQPEDTELVKVVKRFFFILLDFVALPLAFKKQA